MSAHRTHSSILPSIASATPRSMTSRWPTTSVRAGAKARPRTPCSTRHSTGNKLLSYRDWMTRRTRPATISPPDGAPACVRIRCSIQPTISSSGRTSLHRVSNRWAITLNSVRTKGPSRTRSLTRCITAVRPRIWSGIRWWTTSSAGLRWACRRTRYSMWTTTAPSSDGRRTGRTCWTI